MVMEQGEASKNLGMSIGSQTANLAVCCFFLPLLLSRDRRKARCNLKPCFFKALRF